MTAIDAVELLRSKRACTEAIDWTAARHKMTPARMWATCPRGDWMLWIAGRVDIDRRLLVRAACDCARLSLKYVKKGEKRPLVAIQTAEKWCQGKATIKSVRSASDAADAAYAAAVAVAAVAADAADAAVYVSYAAYAAAADAADAAVYASYAAYADDAEAAADAAYAAAVAVAVAAATAAAAAGAAAAAAAAVACAARVRKRIPWSIMRKALTR